MKNVNCLFCNFPWDLFLFLILLGLLLWWLLSTLINRKWRARTEVLNSKISLLESENESTRKDLNARIAVLEADLDECRKSKAAMVPLMAAAKPVKRDDLKIVEGIGPKIEELFNNAGIYSFDDLAATSPERLKEILDEGGPRFQMHNPGTWPQQAAMARDGKWADLQKWQDELKGGRAE